MGLRRGAAAGGRAREQQRGGAVGSQRARWGVGGGSGLVGGRAREGDGGAVSSAAERHRAADRAEERPGLAKAAREPGALEVSGGPRSAVGPAARSAGTNPAEHDPWGRILVEAGRSATRSPRGRTGPGRAPPDGYQGGGRGRAPGLRSLGPWWVWAGAWETGQAPGLRLVRGGVEGPGGLGGEPPRGPRGLGEGSRGRSSVGRCRGAAEECSVGPRMGAAWGCAGAQQRWAAVRRRGGAARGCAGAEQRGAAQGRSVGLRRSAAWARVWAWHGAVKGRSSVGQRRGAAWD